VESATPLGARRLADHRLLKPRVPGRDGGDYRNPLSIFNQWKIFDNLRRSLIPVAIIGLLLAGWFLSPTPALWSLLVAGLLLWPVINSLAALLLHPPPPGTDSGASPAIGYFARCS
jgi:hypothetical protein